MTREVVVLSGVRTAIGGYGGSLQDIPPSVMAAKCVKEAVRRAEVNKQDVGHVVFGNIIHTDSHDHYLARVAGVNGGLPHETPALTLNRLCGSGLQAILTAAQTIMLGDAQVAVAGGAENMSRAPYISQAMRFGARMNDATTRLAATRLFLSDSHYFSTSQRSLLQNIELRQLLRWSLAPLHLASKSCFEMRDTYCDLTS